MEDEYRFRGVHDHNIVQTDERDRFSGGRPTYTIPGVDLDGGTMSAVALVIARHVGGQRAPVADIGPTRVGRYDCKSICFFHDAFVDGVCPDALPETGSFLVAEFIPVRRQRGQDLALLRVDTRRKPQRYREPAR